MKMIKKLMTLCVAVMVAMGAWAATETANGIEWTYTVTDGKASVSSGSSFSSAIPTATTGAITIPSTLGGYSVTSIGDYAFYECSSLKSVTIPDSVTSIGSDAFGKCSSLTRVTIPDSVTSIGSYAFAYCDSLTRASISESLRDQVESGDVFSDGPKLRIVWREVVHWEYAISNGEVTITGIPETTSGEILIPSRIKGYPVTIIGDQAFMGCSSLTSVTIPDSVTSIGVGAFLYCSSLTSVTIPDSVTSIGDETFYGCSSLTSVTIPDSVTSIGLAAFAGCSSLDSLGISTGITSVNDDAFANSKLREFVIKYRNKQSSVVVLNANGGMILPDASSVKKNLASETLGALPSPIRSRYKFLGWYTAPEGGTKVSASTKVTGDVTYYAQWVYDGSATISAYVAEGCEAMGKVTGGKTAKAGTKVTLKATANRGYVFAGWNGPIDDTVNPLNPSLSYVVGEDDAEFIANFISVEEDWIDVWMDCRDEYVTNEEISDINIDVDSGSLPTIKVTGLPSGLKYTAKPMYDRNGELLHEANTIYGKPTKSGVYTVTVTATTGGKKTDTCSAVIVVCKDDERMVKLTVPTWYDDETDADVVPGKVTGAGIYAEGKKVTLKATANKGFVFAGWMDVTSGDWLYSDEDYRSPSLSYIMTDSDMEIEAIFIPVGDDWVDVEFWPDYEYVTNEEISDIYIEVDSGSLATLKVAGLPSGLKYTAKPIYDREGNLLHEANTIYGTPTKSGVYTVTVTATAASKMTDAETAVFVVRKDGENMVKLSVRDWYVSEPDIVVIPGKVSGGGIFVEGKKVTLSATAIKGFVFVGWWDVVNDDWFDGLEDSRNPKLSYVMSDSDMELEAVFAPIAEDNTLDLYVEGEWITANADDNVFYADGEVEVKLEIDSLSLPKASVSGLPNGLKFDAKTNMITGTPTKPGLYTVTVKLTNTTIKKAIEKKFTIEVPNLTAADHLFREDGEYNIANDVGDKYSMYVGVTEFDLPKIRLNSSGTVKVSGLPSGLKYNAGTGAIEGITSKAGNYTVSLTVGGLVSTFTIEVKPLPDWVVGTFDGWAFDDSDFDADKIMLTISNQGKVSIKFYASDGNRIDQDSSTYQLTRFDDGAFVMEHKDRYLGESNDWVDEETYLRISRSNVNGIEFGVLDGWCIGDDGWEPWTDSVFCVQNIWSKDKELNFLPSIYNNTEMMVDLSDFHEKTFDRTNRGYPVDGCSLRLKFGKNGAVTAAFYEPGASKATGTASATLMPYNRNGDTVEALLTIAIAPKGRHSITLALYLEIDTSYGIVYGDDIEVVDYLMEAE